MLMWCCLKISFHFFIKFYMLIFISPSNFCLLAQRVSTTAAENDWLSATVISISATRWWAGGADSTVEGRWQWMTLEP